MEDYPVWLPSEIMADCYLDRWNALSPAQREDVAVALRDSLTEHRFGFEDWRIEEHGPEGEQPVLVLTDTRTLLDFALIPGGTLLPGYDDTQFERLAEIYELVEGWQREAFTGEDNEPADAHQISPGSPYLMPMFASEAPCDLSRNPPVEIGPFLMAVTPALVGTPGMQQFVTIPKWWPRTRKKVARHHEPIPINREKLPSVLSHYRWELPTTWQWEWALQGGKQGVFYWGDRIPEFVAYPLPYYPGVDKEEIRRYEPSWTPEQRQLITKDVRFGDVMWWGIDPERPRVWPYCNRFGLAGMLTHGDTCAPSTVPADPYPFITRGGAPGCWPWQNCGEWLLLLSAAERRHGLEWDRAFGGSCILRPIIPLLGDV